MKLTIQAIACLLFFATAAQAQKCVETADPITNEKQVVFEDAQRFHSTKYELKGGKLLFTKPFYYSGSISGTAPSGQEITFKLENGDIVSLKTVSEATGKTGFDGAGIITTFNFVMELTKEQAGKLASSPIVFIRRPKLTEQGTEDLDKKNFHVKKADDAIKKGAGCISAYM
jgi:hypothetical protein